MDEKIEELKKMNETLARFLEYPEETPQYEAVVNWLYKTLNPVLG